MHARRSLATTFLLLTVPLSAAACSSDGGDQDPAASLPTLTQVTESPSVVATATPSTKGTTSKEQKAAAQAAKKAAQLGRTKPSWLGTRALPTEDNGFASARATPAELRNRRFTLPDTVDPLPGSGYASDVVVPAPAKVLARSTWSSRCPVRANELAWVRVAFHGFDGKRHTGELLVNRTVVDTVTAAFGDLWKANFPIEEMRITRMEELTAKPTGDGNNTGGFVCRAAVGAERYSEHAFGLAIDINPFQNPYKKGDLVLPELATSYLDRDWNRPGMIQPGRAAAKAFTSRGWGWGGSWTSLKDYQHFSESNR